MIQEIAIIFAVILLLFSPMLIAGLVGWGWGVGFVASAIWILFLTIKDYERMKAFEIQMGWIKCR
jgi:hypothetical protein